MMKMKLEVGTIFKDKNDAKLMVTKIKESERTIMLENMITREKTLVTFDVFSEMFNVNLESKTLLLG